MEQDKKKIRRFTAWALFLIVIGGVASFFVPSDTVGHFFGLLKDIITHLII